MQTPENCGPWKKNLENCCCTVKMVEGSYIKHTGYLKYIWCAQKRKVDIYLKFLGLLIYHVSHFGETFAD